MGELGWTERFFGQCSLYCTDVQHLLKTKGAAFCKAASFIPCKGYEYYTSFNFKNLTAKHARIFAKHATF